jgi:hypothetical protein
MSYEHDEEIPIAPPTSPTQKVNDGIVRTPKEFSGGLTLELNDYEIQRAFMIVADVSERYKRRVATHSTLEAMRDELLTRLAEEVNVVATFDPAPILNGEPPVIEFIGKVSGDPIHQYGMDHEQKEWEVKRAQQRGEDWYGQKGRSA